MFPWHEDSSYWEHVDLGLLKVFGVMKNEEILCPQHRDAHGNQALFVVKGGMATIGRANDLGSFT